MKKSIFLFICVLALTNCNKSANQLEQSMTKKTIKYPKTFKDHTVEDNYFGTIIKDPFRWLEDDVSQETKAWVDVQNEVTQDYLSQIPFKQAIVDRYTELWDYEKYGSPFKEGGKYYYFKNDGLQNQSVMYVADNLTDEGVEFLDPNKFSEDGTASLGGMSFNKSGDLLTYYVSEGGSDWRTAYVMNTNTGEVLKDKVNWIKFSGIAWQGNGFYYSRYPEPKKGDELKAANEFHDVYYHRIGDDQSKDRLVFSDKEHPQRNSGARTSDDERFVFISQSESTSGNSLNFIDSKKGNKLVSIVKGFDSDFSVVDTEGDDIFVLTNYNAPNNRLIKINANNVAESNWVDVIPESTDALRGVNFVGGKLFASYLHDASSLVKVYKPSGEFIQNLELPGIGTTGGVSGKKEGKDAFYSFTSFTYPTTIFKLDTETLKSEVFRKPDIKFDESQFVTKQEWYTSKDGTQVPMFITMKKGTQLDGTNPTLLYGYGGFDIPITPGFNLARIPLLEQGGIYVVANIRGGGEFGQKWHKAGTKMEKQNVFDDFIGAAEYLIEKKYTSSEKLAIEGRSNGGLLVGACITQRPDLYKVAFPGVGVLDMLRYHKFTIGWAWAGDYGRSDDSKEMFEYLRGYSPLHNVKATAYPATMVQTADHDDRVVPAHSFKFAAELQDKHNGPNPVLIRIEKSAGHGAGKPTSMVIDDKADQLGFMLYNMGETFK